MRLIDAPVGVFRFDNELVLKTEYSKKYGSVYCPECYILSSGEMFWGGMKTIEDFETKYNYLEVEPVNINLGQESTIHPEPHYDEWCDSCKEYDKEKHSCPRWNKVIKNTVDELKSAQPEIIQCKDCKHSEHWYRDKRRCFLWHEDGIDVFDDGFCNYAERRTDGTD